MDKYEMQKIGHHPVYGDIEYPKGIWFSMDELESFEYTGFAIALPEHNAIFDIYDTMEEASENLFKFFFPPAVHSDKYAELWQLVDSKKVDVLNCTIHNKPKGGEKDGKGSQDQQNQKEGSQ